MKPWIVIGAGLLACTTALAALPAMSESAALPQGSLGLDKKGLHLFDAGGKERAMQALRAKQLDVRGTVAVVLDSQHDLPRLFEVDLATGALRDRGLLPSTGLEVETVCLYRDEQHLLHLFAAAKDGHAQQWLLEGTTPALVRRFTVAAGNKGCRVDDARHVLYVSEEAFGLWAHDAHSEAPPHREAVALKKPFGVLEKGAGKITVLADGVSVMDGSRARNFKRALPVSTLPYAVLTPQAQTDSVPQQGDVADDPAIWVHPGDAARSRILGTNKKAGLHVYDMQGRQTQFLATGRLNNVDLRQNVRFGGESADLAVATQRDDNTVVLFGIDTNGMLAELTRIPTDLDKIYGICLYQPASGGLETFVNDADGRYRQIRIERAEKGYRGKLVRSFKVATQPEGCVADDAGGRLFLGEEKRGVWVMSADSGAPATMSMVLPVGPVLHADTEGIAIYHGAGASYLVVSSQGNNSYVVLDAKAPYKVRGVFRVGFNVAAGIDGTAETDGLDVTSKNLGGPYAQGMLVIQDGYKHLPDGQQNFKYLPWSQVAEAFRLE